MQNRINILYIIDSLYGASGGGTENHLMHLVKFLDKGKYNCLIVAFETGDTPLTREIKKFADIIHLPVGKFYSLNGILKGFLLYKIIKKFHPDIVQTFHFVSDVYGVAVAKISGCKRIISSKRDIGDLKSRRHFMLHSIINKYIDGCIVVANAVGKVVSTKEHMDYDKITTIYNGVDTKKFKPPTNEQYLNARKSLDISEDDVVFGMVAVFRPEKNHDILIKAFEQVLAVTGNTKLLLVGGDVGQGLLDKYKTYCMEKGFGESVIFTGVTSNVQQYLRAMDVACLVPGSNEGLSNAILEKMATGLPLIVTDVGGNAEVVEQNASGYVIGPYDVATLSDAMLELCRNTEARRIMGRRSRQRVEQKFSLTSMIENHQAYYDSLVE